MINCDNDLFTVIYSFDGEVLIQDDGDSLAALEPIDSDTYMHAVVDGIDVRERQNYLDFVSVSEAEMEVFVHAPGFEGCTITFTR